MKLREGAKIFFGACTVYVIVAACGDSYSNNPFATDSGQSDSSALLDSLESPEKEAQADDAVSGSRLKANRYTGTDGSKQFVGWHDSLLGVDCAFMTADDGATRCLPSGPQASSYAYFADSACTSPLFSVLTGCTPPKYILASDAAASACGSLPSKVVAIVATKVTSDVYTPGKDGNGQNSGCSTTAVAPPAGSDLYPVGATIDPSQFVQATIATDP